MSKSAYQIPSLSPKTRKLVHDFPVYGQDQKLKAILASVAKDWKQYYAKHQKDLQGTGVIEQAIATLQADLLNGVFDEDSSDDDS